MKVDLKIECEKVSEIDPRNHQRLDVSLEGACLDSVIEGIGLKELLNYIGENHLIEHLENRGFKICRELRKCFPRIALMHYVIQYQC